MHRWLKKIQTGEFTQKESHIQTQNVYVPPSPTLMITETQELRHTKPQAIEELVDNAIDAAKPGQKVQIDLTLSADEIIIRDNGSGMSYEQLIKKALKYGDADIGRVEKSIGKYDKGLKTSIISLAQKATIYTSSEKDPNAYQVEFDVLKIKENNFTYPISTFKKDPAFGTGTMIKLSPLKNNNLKKDITEVTRHLSETYGPLLKRNEITLTVNGKTLKAASFPEGLDPEKTVTLDFKYKYKGETYAISGTIGLKGEDFSEKSKGIDLFTSKRRIQEGSEIAIQNEGRTNSIYGQIHGLDFLQPNISKKLFHEDEAYLDFEKELVKVLHKNEFFQKIHDDNASTQRKKEKLEKVMLDFYKRINVIADEEISRPMRSSMKQGSFEKDSSQKGIMDKRDHDADAPNEASAPRETNPDGKSPISRYETGPIVAKTRTKRIGIMFEPLGPDDNLIVTTAKEPEPGKQPDPFFIKININHPYFTHMSIKKLQNIMEVWITVALIDAIAKVNKESREAIRERVTRAMSRYLPSN